MIKRSQSSNQCDIIKSNKTNNIFRNPVSVLMMN